jgi:hypothetical protein
MTVMSKCYSKKDSNHVYNPHAATEQEYDELAVHERKFHDAEQIVMECK